jgi:hypothetical protein
MRSAAILLALIIASALAIRLYLTVATGMPFSTDGWPLIRGAEVLIRNSPIDLGNDTAFDGYNNYWPGVMVFGAVGSVITGTKPIDFMRFFIPLAGALTILIFMAVVMRLTRDVLVTTFSALMFSLATSHVIFTAGVTKETLANPFYVALIFLAVMKSSLSSYIGMVIVIVALVITHHLTAFIALAIILAATLLNILYRIRIGKPKDLSFLAVLATLIVAIIVYYPLYGIKGFKITLTPQEILTISAYGIVILAMASYAYTENQVRRLQWYPLIMVASFAVIFAFTFILTKKSVVPGLPPLPLRYVIYGLPYLLLPSFVLLSREYIRNVKTASIIFGWFSAVMATELYSIFGGNPIGAALTYRSFNFLVPSVFIMAAVTIASFLKNKNTVLKAAAVIVIMTFVITAPVAVYNVVSYQDLPTSCWVYKSEELEAGYFLSNYGGVTTVIGDTKVLFLMQYFKIRTDMKTALSYLLGIKKNYNGIMFIYKHMLDKGFILSLNVVVLQNNTYDRLLQSNIIYSNGYVEIFEAS